MTAPSWAPTLSEVGQRIPTRTRDTQTPGSDTLLGTFTVATTPTDTQATQAIADACNWVTGAVGDLPTSGTDLAQILALAASAAAWRAAADIEIAYPLRDADVRTYAALDQRAKDELAQLRLALATETGGPVELVPIWQAPVPVTWGDDLLL